MLKKKDGVLIGIVLCAAALIMLFASNQEKLSKNMDIGSLLASSPVPMEDEGVLAANGMSAPPAEEPEEATATPRSEAAQIIADAVGEEWVADGYLLLTVRGAPYDVIPLKDNGEFVLAQNDIEATNTIHTTKRSAWMAHSTCDNQDCVDQGIMTLDNVTQRILGNMIICLPNGLMLELLTAEDLAEGLRAEANPISMAPKRMQQA